MTVKVMTGWYVCGRASPFRVCENDNGKKDETLAM
jgi:hypothetical protein